MRARTEIACRKPSLDLSIALLRRNRIAAHSLRNCTQSGTKLNGPRSGPIGSLRANGRVYRPGHTSILGAGWLSVNMFWNTFLYIILGVRATMGAGKNARLCPNGREARKRFRQRPAQSGIAQHVASTKIGRSLTPGGKRLAERSLAQRREGAEQRGGSGFPARPFAVAVRRAPKGIGTFSPAVVTQRRLHSPRSGRKSLAVG